MTAEELSEHMSKGAAVLQDAYDKVNIPVVITTMSVANEKFVGSMRGTAPGAQHAAWIMMVRADGTVLSINEDGEDAEFDSLVQCINTMVIALFIASTFGG